MRDWEEMSNRERAEQTFNDIKKRQERRKQLKAKGEKEAKELIIVNSIRTTQKAKESKSRGCRSF